MNIYRLSRSKTAHYRIGLIISGVENALHEFWGLRKQFYCENGQLFVILEKFYKLIWIYEMHNHSIIKII